MEKLETRIIVRELDTLFNSIKYCLLKCENLSQIAQPLFYTKYNLEQALETCANLSLLYEDMDKKSQTEAELHELHKKYVDEYYSKRNRNNNCDSGSSELPY